jgi:hypothetical protein
MRRLAQTKRIFFILLFFVHYQEAITLISINGVKMRDILAKIGMQLMLLLLRNIFIYFVIFIKNKIIFLI